MVVGEASDGRKGLFLGQDGAPSHLESGNLTLTTGAAQQQFSSDGKRELQSSKHQQETRSDGAADPPGIVKGKKHAVWNIHKPVVNTQLRKNSLACREGQARQRKLA
ncbi:ATP-dependent bile acid permease [Aspergillus luchuensis]|uniref:ATP-dependent bile acid permease n=1 Tax=Aspergillus kawachii TaxID=1069201 RepID=A0A146FQV3_ASPKA|nr:ATP-dependent bile acid permease [Aspergillus luchuensis]